MADSSITDWIQAASGFAGFILSALTLIYVVKTLRMQNSVNEQQFKLLQIESNRAAREVRPILSIVPVGYHTIAGYTDRTSDLPTTGFCLTFSNAAAYNVCFEYFYLLGNGRYSENMKEGYVTNHIEIGMPFYFIVQHPINHIGQLQFRVHYKDVDGKHLFDNYRFSIMGLEPYNIIGDSVHPGVNKIRDDIPNFMTMAPLSTVKTGSTDVQPLSAPWPRV